MKLAKYAVSNCMSEEPALKWWVKDALKKRDSILVKVKSKFWRTSHKFGIKINKSVQEAYAIEKDT